MGVEWKVRHCPCSRRRRRQLYLSGRHICHQTRGSSPFVRRVWITPRGVHNQQQPTTLDILDLSKSSITHEMACKVFEPQLGVPKNSKKGIGYFLHAERSSTGFNRRTNCTQLILDRIYESCRHLIWRRVTTGGGEYAFDLGWWIAQWKWSMKIAIKTPKIGDYTLNRIRLWVISDLL